MIGDVHMFTHLPLHTVPASLQLLAVVSFGCASRPATPLERVVASPPPLITAIFPSAGSTAGYTSITINGTGFQSGATVMVDDAILHGRIGASDIALHLQTPAHAAGPVDVVVTNPDGQRHRVSAAYSYTAPESFDINGAWRGYSAPLGRRSARHSARPHCRGVLHERCVVRMTLSPPLAVVDGAFALSRDDGIALSGSIVSDVSAIGTLNLPLCAATTCAASKQSASRRHNSR